MLRHERFATTDTSSVRMIAMGGGPSTAALVRDARAGFGVPVVVRYTCTEAGVGVGTAPDDPPEDAEETVGRARAGVELTVRDDSDRPVPAGELGHVCLRSAGGDGRVLARPRGHGGGLHRRRRGAHRRPRISRRAGPAAPVGPHQGDVRARRVQRLSPRGRERARGPPRRRPRRRGPPGRPGHGRDRRGRSGGARSPATRTVARVAAHPRPGPAGRLQAPRSARRHDRAARAPPWRRSIATPWARWWRDAPAGDGSTGGGR